MNVSDASAAPDTSAAHCWQCGYQLRGVQSAACPECGRPFDRADPTSMNLGRPMGRAGRWALAPLGRALVACAALAAALLLGTARWPVDGWHFSFFDLHYYGKPREWPARWRTLTGVDAAYMAGLALWFLTVIAWLGRTACHAFARVRYRPPRAQRGKFLFRSLLVILLACAGVAGVGLGWPYRLGQRWVANVEMERRQSTMMITGVMSVLRPMPMPTDHELITLRSAVTQGPNPQARITALNVLIEVRAPECFPILESAARADGDAAVRALATRVIAITHDPRAAPLILTLLDDPDPAVRAAAADAIVIAGYPMYQLGNEFDWGAQNYRIDGTSISIHALTRGNLAPPTPAEPALATRDKLNQMMAAGATAEEREAAARALLHWPPGKFRFRYAEWGVFLTDTAGNRPFVQAQLDELPPFVHRIGNPAAELAGRITPNTMTILKPVIHLTVDRPLPVDLQICLAEGRPWVVFPRPDDLALRGHYAEGGRRRRDAKGNVIADPPSAITPIEQLEPPATFAPMDLREGYPWMSPKHREYAWGRFGGGPPTSRPANIDTIDSVGVRWQSLIVSPTKLAWMAPPDVGPNPHFAWWNRLREVDCSYVSNRGESDRLLYYDGPSQHKAPVSVSLTGDRLRITHHVAGKRAVRPVSYIHVTGQGVAISSHRASGPDVDFDVAGATTKPPDAAMADLRRAIEAQGLSHSEAAGLVDCWRPAFFDNPGRRALILMTPEDYDALCPMTVRPEPTEKARVGILWTEFPPQ